jgi:flagellar biosynthesis/type III secretory pathway chaperone
VGDNETAALESNETAGNDATEIVSEKQDLILELDEDDEVGVNSVVAAEKG